ncbi:hypothetical protein L6164_026391 [Bauhinia variegata]|uniref:Uncharacterized protein n=1 Tax=Bauhinia variegata TaxID=167791 RepID=A0ACB9LQZ9_BAUVA|nr:hypothetical protein L6164_026391 [Bauhinia variegata]
MERAGQTKETQIILEQDYGAALIDGNREGNVNVSDASLVFGVYAQSKDKQTDAKTNKASLSDKSSKDSTLDNEGDQVLGDGN